MESNEAYNRTIYHLHQELEFTVPFEDTLEMSRRFIELFEENLVIRTDNHDSFQGPLPALGAAL